MTEFQYIQVIAAFIGYIGLEGTATITHTFAAPTSVSHVLLWNSYYQYESFMERSVKDVELIFRDELNNVITSENVSFVKPTLTDLTPEVINLSAEVLNVKKVDFVINTLWAGTSIHLRRLAYAGNGLVADIGELENNPSELVKIVDLMGRETHYIPNTVLMYIYADGSVERKFNME
ncbi:MAG: SepF-like predicted cell division protein (DUF552 family) [Crocinitomicaceae bacterium]